MARVQSHSSLDKYATCPRLYYETYIIKSVKFEPSAATEFGLALHTAVENLIVTKQEPTVLPTDYKDGYAHYKKLRANITALVGMKPREIYAERKLAFNHDMLACDYWGTDAMFRGVLDVLAVWDKTALIGDHKTGKEVTGSLQLYRNALAVFLTYPQVETVYTAYWHSDPSITDRQPAAIKRSEMLDIYNEIKRAVLLINSAEALGCWIPKPSGLCPASERNPNYKGCPAANCKHSAFYIG